MENHKLVSINNKMEQEQEQEPWYKDRVKVMLGLMSLLAVVLLIVVVVQAADDDDGDEGDVAAAATLPVSVVSPEWVYDAIQYKYADGEKPENYDFPRHHNLIIYEHARSNLSYLEGHIPHSVFSDAGSYEVGYPTGFLKNDTGMEAAAGSNGVCTESDCTIVIYARNPVYASRLWYILAYMGVKDVRVMNGTFAVWVQKGLPSEEVPSKVESTDFRGRFKTAVKKGEKQVEKYYKTNKAQMVDVRSLDEYEGSSSGSAELIEKGRIPYALWGAQANAGSYTTPDGILHPTSTILNYWKMGNVNTGSKSPPIFYCATGYRASLAFMYACLMEVEGAVYPDGWWGWSTTWVHNATFEEPPTPGWEQYPSGREIYP